MQVRIVHDSDSVTLCRQVRQVVFIEEQGVDPAEEWDGLDSSCVQFLASLEGRAVGTARLLPLGDGTAKAQRVAVLAELRGRGIGRALMAALEAEALRRDCVAVLLGAQLRALGFYESLGYVAYGDEFLDANIPHRMMRKELASA